MFGSSNYHGPSSHPLSHDQTGNPSSSSTNYYLSPSMTDQLYQFDFVDILDYSYPLIDLPSFQDSSYSNFTSYFDNEQTLLQEMTTPATAPPSNFHMDELNGERVPAGSRIALRMKTDLEIVDDGYRWRKYGKKKVKSSPNPRNYYRCWVVGCNVKKRIERDRDDPSYVITTYEGVHNHKNSSMIHHSTTREEEWNFQFS